MGRHPAYLGLLVAGAQHWRTETVVAERLAWHFTTASLRMQLTSGWIVFDHSYGQIINM